jgi:hypothetical protein
MPDVYSNEPFNPRTCGQVAERLSTAIDILERADIRVSGLSRLKHARDRLRKTAADDHFPDDEKERQLTAWAIRDAQDYDHILRVFDSDVIRELAPEIQRAIAGDPRSPLSLRQALTFQTQFWVGAVLTYAGLEVQVPMGNGEKMPDYFVLNGTLRHGVEVKRPKSATHLRNLLSGAAKQLAAQSTRGAVVVDISDCLDQPTLLAHGDDIDLLTEAADAAFTALADELGNLVLTELNRFGYASSFSNIITLIVLARGWYWPTGASAVPVYYSNARNRVFTSQPGNLWWHRGHHLSMSFAQGMLNLGGATLEEISVSEDPRFLREYGSKLYKMR